MTLADLKTFLKVDTAADDANLTALMGAAESHVRGAVNNYNDFYGKDDDFTALADMCMKLIVLELYDRPLRDGAEMNYSYPIRSMITQLSYWKGGA